jgi:hypothetical protein
VEDYYPQCIVLLHNSLAEHLANADILTVDPLVAAISNDIRIKQRITTRDWANYPGPSEAF